MKKEISFRKRGDSLTQRSPGRSRRARRPQCCGSRRRSSRFRTYYGRWKCDFRDGESSSDTPRWHFGPRRSKGESTKRALGPIGVLWAAVWPPTQHE